MNPTDMSLDEFAEQHGSHFGGRELRDYQREAVAAVEADWAAGILRTSVVLPTGSGKSTVLGQLISDAYQGGGRVVVFAHRLQLLRQIKLATMAVDPSIPDEHFGFMQGPQDDHHAPIVLATLQTLAKGARQLALGPRSHIFWDEVHHAPAKGYHDTFTGIGGYDGALVCGVTATMYRASSSKGQQAEIGLGDIIEKIAFERDLRWAIENGHLVMPTGLTVRIEALNALNKVKNVAGDFNQKQLAEIMEAAVEYTVDAVEMHAIDRRSIVFAASVAASKEVADRINDRGKLRAVSITGEMTEDEREPYYEAFQTGDLDVIVTVQVLTEGADFPACDCVVLARPTRSRIMYSQMVGRALRTHPGKDDALVMDLTGTVREMKLIHLAELVHGLGVDISEYDEEGEEIEQELCGLTGEPVISCMCESCVQGRTPEPRERIKRMGPVDMVTVDLLDGDDTLWLETPGGVPFVSLDDRERQGWLVFVWPKDGDRTTGLWSVGNLNTRNDKLGGWAFTDMAGEPMYFPLATAFKKAQAWIVESNFKLPSRMAGWYRKNQAPSELQNSLALRLGIPSYEGMTRGRLSDEISIAFASQRLDDLEADA
jgi:superfamily II DNA or RNA helicase